MELWRFTSTLQPYLRSDWQKKDSWGRAREDTHFGKERAASKCRIHGVSFDINNSLVSQLTELPQGICERLMTVHLKLVGNQMVTVESAYAFTLDIKDIKEAFYASLDSILWDIPKEDKITFLSHYSSRDSHCYKLWGGSIGKDREGNINSNGVVLMTKPAKHSHTITNTNIFRQKIKFKTLSPDINMWYITSCRGHAWLTCKSNDWYRWMVDWPSSHTQVVVTHYISFVTCTWVSFFFFFKVLYFATFTLLHLAIFD